MIIWWNQTIILLLSPIKKTNTALLNRKRTDYLILGLFDSQFRFVELGLSRGSFLESRVFFRQSRVKAKFVELCQVRINVSTKNYLIITKLISQMWKISLQVLNLLLIFFLIRAQMSTDNQIVISTYESYMLAIFEIFLLLLFHKFLHFFKGMDVSKRRFSYKH